MHALRAGCALSTGLGSLGSHFKREKLCFVSCQVLQGCVVDVRETSRS